jgi:hypothetical protein
MLTGIVQGLSPEQLEKHDPAGGWSPRGVVAHLAGATKSMTLSGRRWVKGDSPKLPADFDLDYFNKRQYEKRADMSLDALLEEWHGSHRDLKAFLESLTVGDLDKRGDHPAQTEMTVRELMRVITFHEAMHIVFIIAATQKLEPNA